MSEMHEPKDIRIQPQLPPAATWGPTCPLKPVTSVGVGLQGHPDVGVGYFVGDLKHLKLSEGPCSNKTDGMVVFFLESPIWTCSAPCAENADSSATMDLENFQPSKFWESNGQSQHNVAIACHCHWGPLRPWLIWIAITVYWHSFTASVEKLLEHGGEAGWSYFQALHKEICAETKGKPWKTHQKVPRGFGDFSYSPSICFILFVETPISPKLSQLDPPNIFSRHLFSRCQDGSKSSDACCSWWQKKSQQPRKMAILVPTEIWRNTDQFHQRASTLQHVAEGFLPRPGYRDFSCASFKAAPPSSRNWAWLKIEYPRKPKVAADSAESSYSKIDIAINLGFTLFSATPTFWTLKML